MPDLGRRMKLPKALRHVYAWDLAYKLGSGPAAPLVVCTDADPQKRTRATIDESISLKEFESGLGTLPKDREIVFYCSSSDDASAVGRAAEYQEKGYTRVGVLIGGINAWNAIASFLPGKR
jgi:rhodanese-related sulfurtransferase